jgi:radical SAM superfamily enzyme YgiQ (UPF0313 family)
MNEIILVNIPPWGIVMPPLGIAYLATYLKSKGVKVIVYDLNERLYRAAKAAEKKIWDLDTINAMSPATIAGNLFTAFEPQIREFIEELQPASIVGCSANNLISTTFSGMLGRCIKARHPGATIIVGGPGCFHSWDRQSVPKGAVDFFVIGEGEEALYRLLQDRRSGIPDIPGVISAADDEATHYCIPRASILDIDSIPFPTFEEFDMRWYGNGKPYRPLPLLMSRGCINQCSYCIDCYMNSPFRARSPEKIIAEIKHHLDRYGITHVEFNDLLCNGNLVQLEKMCEGLIRENLGILWISYAAIRKNMTEELLKKMEQAGCTSLCYGIESGSDPVLRKMNKHYTRNDAAAVIRKTYDAGIEVRINIIVGFPGETDADFRQTLDFVHENKRFITQVTNVSSFVMMPGADVGIYPHRYGIRFADKQDLGSWTDESGLTPARRVARAQEVCRCLRDWAIPNLITNYQKDAGSGGDGECQAVAGNKEQSREQKQLVPESAGSPHRKQRSLMQASMLCGLFVMSVIADAYLFLLKKVRGSIIFPGS